MLVEVDRRPNVDHAVSPKWDRNTGQTEVVVADSRTASCSCASSKARTLATRSTIPSGTHREHQRASRRSRAILSTRP